jgi:hypothetical protein
LKLEISVFQRTVIPQQITGLKAFLFPSGGKIILLTEALFRQIVRLIQPLIMGIFAGSIKAGE